MTESNKFALECLYTEDTNINNDPERRIKIIKECVEAGLNINTDEYQILILAIQNNDTQTAKFIIENNINMQDGLDLYLDEACVNNNVEITKLLLELGADINSKYHTSISKTRNLDIIKLLVEHGADPFVNSNELLIRVSQNDKYLPITEYLIGIGMDCTKLNNKQVAKIFIQNGNLQIKKLLLEHGINSNAMTSDYTRGRLEPTSMEVGYTDGEICLLELAIIRLDFNTCKLLLEYGADINLCYNIINKQYDCITKNSPRHDRRETVSKTIPFVELFMEYGLDISEFVVQMKFRK